MTNRSLLFAALLALLSASTARAFTTSGLELWLKADAGVSTSGSSVTNWVDQSGGTVYSFTAPTAGQQPTFVSSWRNGKPAILFDGSNDFMNDTVNTMDLNAALTIFVVAQINVRQNFNGLFRLYTGANPATDATSQLEVYWQAGSNDTHSGSAVYVANRLTSFSVLQSSSNKPPVGNPFLEEITATPSTVGMRINNLAQSGTPSGSALTPLSTAAFPGVGIGYSTARLNGYIAEVLVYNRVLTLAERNQVWEELSFAYNVPEPASLASVLSLGTFVLFRRRRA